MYSDESCKGLAVPPDLPEAAQLWVDFEYTQPVVFIQIITALPLPGRDSGILLGHHTHKDMFYSDK